MLGQIKLRKEIADRLKQARIDAGYLTPEEFCEKHEINLDDYKNFETGETTLRASQAILYCDLLNIGLHWLMLGEEITTPTKKSSKTLREMNESEK